MKVLFETDKAIVYFDIKDWSFGVMVQINPMMLGFSISLGPLHIEVDLRGV